MKTYLILKSAGIKGNQTKKELWQKDLELFKKLYPKLIKTAKNKEALKSEMIKAFKAKNLKMNRDKFFKMQDEMKQEAEREIYLTKRLIHESKLQRLTEILKPYVIKTKGEALNEFVKKKEKAIKKGVKKGNKTSAKNAKEDRDWYR